MGPVRPTIFFSLAVLAVPATLLLGAMLVSKSQSDEREEFDAFSRRFDDAQFRKDSELLQQMLAADMLFIRGSGKATGKNEFIRSFTDTQTDFEAFEIVNRRIVPLGDKAAVVSAEAVIKGRTGNLRFEEHFRYSDTFARIGGSWQVVHVQVTPIQMD
jgi:ketosteroid isomerase-like protein